MKYLSPKVFIITNKDKKKYYQMFDDRGIPLCEKSIAEWMDKSDDSTWSQLWNLIKDDEKQNNFIRVLNNKGLKYNENYEDIPRMEKLARLFISLYDVKKKSLVDKSVDSL
jgi:hypothetical protein